MKTYKRITQKLLRSENRLLTYCKSTLSYEYEKLDLEDFNQIIIKAKFDWSVCF